jgi:hypothetical protein
MVLERPPDAAASFTVDLAERLREELFDDVQTYGGLEGYPHFRYTTTVFTGGSDHYIFSDPTVGVPMPMIIQWPDKFYHSTFDTLEKVSPATLNRSGTLAAAYAYFIATAGEQETTWLAYEMLARFQGKVAQMVQTAWDEHPVSKLDYLLERQATAVHTLHRLHPQIDVTAVLQETLALVTQAKVRIQTITNNQQPITNNQDEWEQKAATLIPTRNYRGPGLAIGATAELTAAEKDELHQFSKGRKGVYTAQTLAEYWADGQRTILDIIDRVEMEIGIRDAELIVREFELLKRLGLVTLADKS